MLLTRSDFTPILLCLQGGLGEFSLLKGHIFERMCQVASTGVASLTAKGLDPLRMAMRAISDEGMDLSIGDAEVRTLLIGAGEALGVHALGSSPPAFHLAPRAHRSWRGPSSR